MTLRTIDEITITKATLDGTERFAGRDGSGDFKATTQAIADLVALTIIPIGTILPHDDTFPNTPALGAEWVECDGATISTGVYSGYRARNLNGANVVLTLTWTADGGGSFATGLTTDLTGLNIGDTVTGTGISSIDGEPAMVMDITGTTIVINDTAATGSIASTFTNEGVYIGGGETGGSIYDQLQNHIHRLVSTVGTTGTPGIVDSATASSSGNPLTGAVLTDGLNGTPRSGPRVKPHTRFLKYVMKIS